MSLMQGDLHALLNQQLGVSAGVFVHVVHDATHLRGAVLLPLAFSQTRDMRVRQVHHVAFLALHHHLLLAVLLEQVSFAQVQHVGQRELQSVRMPAQIDHFNARDHRRCRLAGERRQVEDLVVACQVQRIHSGCRTARVNRVNRAAFDVRRRLLEVGRGVRVQVHGVVTSCALEGVVFANCCVMFRCRV